MRLAHLHVPDLISYGYSLRLQNAILEKHFKYKDWLRTAGASDDSPAARHVRSGVKNNTYAYGSKEEANDRQTDVGPHGADALNGGMHDHAAGARLHDAALKKSHTHPLTSKPHPGSGRCTTLSTLQLKQNSSFHEPQHDHTTPPDPVLLTFSTPPTYTVGRRHLQTNPISSAQQSFLSANGLATFHASPRGGLLTYHAPGQVTGYVIADLRRHGITARCWVKLLEESVMRTCGVWDVKTGRTNDPGVWVLDSGNEAGHTGMHNDGREIGSVHEPKASDRKICAIGVQVSRGVTSHGVGLNVYDPPPMSPLSSRVESGTSHLDFTPAQLSSPSYEPSTRGYLSWGFSRIVACGLEGKSVSWMGREMARSRFAGDTPSNLTAEPQQHSPTSTRPPSHPTEEAVAAAFAREILYGINAMKGADKETVEGIYRIQEADILT